MPIVPTDENKDTLKIYGELSSKIRDLLISKTDNSDDYDEKYMKIKFNSDDDLPLNKTLEPHNVLIVISSVFHESNRSYPHIFLDEGMSDIKMLYYDKADVSEGIDVN